MFSVLDFVLRHFIVMARGAELKRMDKDRELPVTVRLSVVRRLGRSYFSNK